MVVVTRNLGGDVTQRMPKSKKNFSITFLTQYYPPEIGAPQRRISDIAERFAASGHVVTVLTALPNYPTGRVFPSYGGLVRTEHLNGVRVIRTWIYPTQKADYVRRLTSYFSFVLSSLVVGAATLSRSDFLFVESPPLFLGLAGVLLSRIKRARLIFNVSDLWPESAVRLEILRRGSLVHRLAEGLEQLLYRHAWVVSGQSKTILEDIGARSRATRVYHLSNGVDTARFAPCPEDPALRSVLAPAGSCIAMYAGLHGLAQGLEQILDAAERLGSESGIRFVLIGDGPERLHLQELATAAELRNLIFLGPLPSSEVPGYLASADVLLVPLKAFIPGAVPSKLYESMATGKPVILIAGGEAAEIVLESRAGIVVNPGDIDSLVTALRTLRDDPPLRRLLGVNGNAKAIAQFDRGKIVQAFDDFLSKSL